MATSLTIITRIGGGTRQVITDEAAVFGRAADNALIVGGQFTSRKHGLLLFENDLWLIVNESPNGTQVNGKNLGRKPRILHDRDIVSVSDEVIFEVRLEPCDKAAPTAEPATKSNADALATSDLPKRTKLWVGIGVYMVLLCLLFVFLLTLRDQKQSQPNHLTPLTRQQIASEIRGATPTLEKDERQFREALQTAQELTNRLESSPDALYRAYRAFSRALALSGRRDFADGLAQRQYIDIRDRLIDKVAFTYAESYEYLRSNRFRVAIRGFQKVRELYPDYTSRIHRNATRQRKVASDQYSRQKRHR